VDFSGALAIIGRFIAEERKNPALVFTPNAEILVKAHDDAEFGRVLKNADLVVPDGTSLLWASKVLKRPLETRVTGIDLMQRLLTEAENAGWSVYFLGAKPDVIVEAAARVKHLHPGLKLVGYHHGYFDDDFSVIEGINKLRPDILFVGMGAPKQELWLTRNREELNCRVALGVGGSFDVLSGRVDRAPLWMQNKGLEWLYRYIREPSRLKRSILLPRFVRLVLKEKFGTSKGETTQ